MALPPILRDRLRLPAIASPLFIISGPDLVIAQCKAGIVGSFPSLNARPISMLDEWLAAPVRADYLSLPFDQDVTGSPTSFASDDDGEPPVLRDRFSVPEIRRDMLAHKRFGDVASTKLIERAVAKYLASAEPFDLIFVDPPYAKAGDFAPKLTAALPAVLAPGATVVTESDRREPLLLGESAFKLRSEHNYGDTLIRIFDAL